jgi:hypothetical protein
MPWRNEVAKTVLDHLRAPGNTYDTTEISLLLNLLHRTSTSRGGPELRHLATMILSRKTPVRNDTSVGIAALMLLRYGGKSRLRPYSESLRKLARTTKSSHARRYLLTALFLGFRSNAKLGDASNHFRHSEADTDQLRTYLKHRDFESAVAPGGE